MCRFNFFLLFFSFSLIIFLFNNLMMYLIFYFIVLWCVCGFFRDDVRDYDILFIGCKMFGNL